MNYVVNAAFDHYIKPFLLALIAKTIQLLKLLIISPVGRDYVSDPDLEAAVQQVPDRRTNHKYLTNNNLDWANIVTVFCLIAAIGLALLSFQIPSRQVLHPTIFYFLGLSVLLAFTCILVSKFIHFNYCPIRISIALIFHHFGLFFGVRTFFISITIPFPLWFKCNAYSIYVAAVFLVLLCNIHFNKYYEPYGFKYLTPNNSISKTAIHPAEESCRDGTSTIDDQGCTNSIVRRERTPIKQAEARSHMEVKIGPGSSFFSAYYLLFFLFIKEWVVLWQLRV